MELTIKIDPRKKEAKALVAYLQNLSFVDIDSKKHSKSIRKTKKASASDFVKKWAGFLKNKDTDSSKYDYLMDKYK
ncbi:MAG: hypothetical protein U0T31_08090 [Chitinophagales bacterium]